MTAAPLRVALLAACVGGILGSLVRFGITDAVGVTLGFPWAVFAINVVGSALLAALPAVPAVRRTPWLGVFLGTGVLGGFTTMSTASAQTVVLLDHDRTTTALAYAGGTLLAALAAAALVSRYVDPQARSAAEADEVDE
ncbi:fluoride efflux transporter FluC [Marmoricola sp. RAF53]|uniref:fluoride efflux transporter FluC n=1 Tax=Marmoricola sp. RAF53 TaxID=3233059 RepID=UPI003F9ACB20